MYVTLDLILNRSDGDPEYSLAAAENIDHFLLGVRGIDGLTVAEQGDVGEWPLRVELLAQDVDGGADLLEAHTGIEEPLDHLQLDQA